MLSVDAVFRKNFLNLIVVAWNIISTLWESSDCCVPTCIKSCGTHHWAAAAATVTPQMYQHIVRAWLLWVVEFVPLNLCVIFFQTYRKCPLEFTGFSFLRFIIIKYYILCWCCCTICSSNRFFSFFFSVAIWIPFQPTGLPQRLVVCIEFECSLQRGASTTTHSTVIFMQTTIMQNWLRKSQNS